MARNAPYDRGVYDDGTPTACVVIAGANTPDHKIHVHGAECRDLRKPIYAEDRDYPTEVRDVRDVVEYLYGPDAGSFYEEWGVPEEDWWKAWREYEHDVRVFPCVSLPTDIGREEDPA